jgi:plasmid stabilization system protein ParE
MKVRLSARACSDIEHVYAWLWANRGSEAANKFLSRTRLATEFIAEHPHAGPHPSWATRHKTLRFWPIKRTRCLIFYVIDEMGVSIERVLDGRRDVHRILEHSRDEPSEAGGGSEEES